MRSQAKRVVSRTGAVRASAAARHGASSVDGSPRVVAQRQLVEGIQDSPRLVRQQRSVQGLLVQRPGGPVQRVKISALWLPVDDTDKREILALIGTATDTKEVSDENLEKILAVYERPRSNAAGRDKWKAEQDLRAKSKARSEGGLRGTLLPFFGPGAEGVLTGLVGAAKNYNELPVENLTGLHRALQRIKPLEEAKAPEAPKPVRGVRAPEAKAPDPAKAIEAELASIVSALDEMIRREPQVDVERKVDAAKAEAAGLKAQGLKALERRFGPDVDKAIEAWKTYMTQQQSTAFHVLYRANQMTARFIAPNSAAVGGSFPAMVIPPGGGALTTGKREMTLNRDVPSIKGRVDPATWKGKDVAAVKREKGLYELSASLLKGRDNEGGIFKQLKHYENATALFMPAADMEDHQILAALMDNPRASEAVKEVGAVMTRIIRAQASDMGAKYVDYAPTASATTDVHYGKTGRIVRYEGVPGIMATPYELEARNTNALQYDRLVEGAVSIVNEIVIDYRKGREALFPMYAKWDDKASEWYVVTPAGEPTNQKINDKTGVVF